MSLVPRNLAEQVRLRVRNRCEYCQLAQEGQEASFHIDHVIPLAENGPTTLKNLALACVSCSLRKSAKQTALDTETNQQVLLFNPRDQKWDDHFRWEADEVLPLSPIGRITITALSMNRPGIRMIRLEEMERGRHPPNQ